ncbi:hypothetical protein CVT25_014707 [Psilocybe cyanescens]|uniref:Uncharacterized protein n=1 Tax=Psilocybe cyanescens TaxID=93625 RepID=A0A409WR30_PSICY|nr:hypothetical protein CVT25_014707 [Psilocybe cyanescens]
MYIHLTNITRSKLQHVERGLEVAWVTAQQSNARQKVEVSISVNDWESEYWKNLGESNAFEGQILVDCIHRLHDDVLKVWNFNDSTGILSGISFFVELIGFVKPLIENTLDGTSIRHPVSAFGDRGATDLVTLLKTFGHNSVAIYYLYDKYQQYPPRILSNRVVTKAIEDRKTALQQNTLDSIDSVAEFSTHPEQVIEREILKQIPQESVRPYGSGVAK